MGNDQIRGANLSQPFQHIPVELLVFIRFTSKAFYFLFQAIASRRLAAIGAVLLINGLQAHANELPIAEFESVVAGWLTRDNGYKNESIRVENQKVHRKELEKKVFGLNSCRHYYHNGYAM
jgi:hypothetical protein